MRCRFWIRGWVRRAGSSRRVGAPQCAEVPIGFAEFIRNLTLTDGMPPARACIEKLLPDVLKGRINPGRAFDRTVGPDDIPGGCRAMADREVLKALVRP